MRTQSHLAQWLVVLLDPVHRAFMPCYFRIEILHRERLPVGRAMILAPTHRSMWDSLILTHLTRRPLRYLASRTMFTGVRGFFMNRLGAFPVNTERPGAGVMRHCRELVLAGKPLVIFPEGTIYYYGPHEVHPLKRGVAWLALDGPRWSPDPPPLVVPIRLIYGDRQTPVPQPGRDPDRRAHRPRPLPWSAPPRSDAIPDFGLAASPGRRGQRVDLGAISGHGILLKNRAEASRGRGTRGVFRFRECMASHA